MKRYVRTKNNTMLETDGGPWVRHTDALAEFDKRDAKIARLQDQAKDLRDACCQKQEIIDADQTIIAELRSQETLKEKDAEIEQLQNELRDAESKYFELGCQYQERGERMIDLRAMIERVMYRGPIEPEEWQEILSWFTPEGKAK